MNYTDSGKLAIALVEEILEAIYKYEDAMLLPTAVGCLETVKMQLLLDHVSADEEDDDD